MDSYRIETSPILARVGVVALVAAVVLAVPAADGAVALDTSVTNLELAGELQSEKGGFTVAEASQGVDLNGDGEMLDEVLHFQVAGKPVRNTGLAAEVSDLAGLGAFLSVTESDQGQDLNGDGDTTDSVLHLYQPGAPIKNLGLSGFSADATGMLRVSESGQGQDLNGDGDATDTVAHVYDFDSGAITNLELAHDDTLSSEAGILFTVPEDEQGATDLNGDGDAVDDVLHLFEPGAGVTNLGLAADLPVAADFFKVEEANQGATDLNGDGDALDDVLHRYDASTGTVVNMGLATGGGSVRPGGDSGVIFTVREPDQGATDLNGDGDTLDDVVHAFTPTGGVTNNGFALFSTRSGVLFRTAEADQDQDLNGDGDKGDSIFIFYDFVTSSAINSGLDGNNAVEADGGYLISVSEFRQATTDFNSDGDTADNVMFFWDPATNTSVNLGLAGFAEDAPGTFHVQEADQGMTDLNGDGDATDTVIYFYGEGTVVSTGLATPVSSETAAAGLGFHFVVSEADQGMTDLNGDGDATDGVIHTFTNYVPHDVGLVDPSQGLWYLRDHSTGAVTSFFYGDPGDAPFMGDWDCDGVETPGLFRHSDAFAYLRNSNTQGIADTRFFFGNPSDVPLAGDFDGDGCDTVSIYRPDEQRFFIINHLGENEGGLGAADFDFLFGNPGDKPVVGDWDGDGVDEVGLHRESTGFFYWRDTLTTGIADGEIFFGDPNDRFVAGDWGIVDGVDTPAVFRPTGTTFFFRHTLTQGVADSQFVFGESSWLPVAGAFGLG